MKEKIEIIGENLKIIEKLDKNFDYLTVSAYGGWDFNGEANTVNKTTSVRSIGGTPLFEPEVKYQDPETAKMKITIDGEEFVIHKDNWKIARFVRTLLQNQVEAFIDKDDGQVNQKRMEYAIGADQALTYQFQKIQTNEENRQRIQTNAKGIND